MSTVQYSTLDFINRIKNNGNTYSYNYQKKVREANTNVQDLQDDIDTFRKNIRDLRKYSEDSVTRNKVERQIKAFVKGYNDLKEGSETVKDKNIQKELKKLDTLIDENEKTLKKLGVKRKDNILKFDSDIFKKVEDKDVAKLSKSLFVGKDSFMTQANRIMRTFEKEADAAEYSVSIRKCHSITQYSDNEVDIATDAYNLSNVSAAQCQSLVEKIQTNTISEDEKNLINSTYLPQFVEDYNKLMDFSENNSIIKSLQELTQSDSIKSQLSNIGISVKDDGKLEFNSITMDDTFCNTYCDIFKNTDSYASQIKEFCKSTINSVLKADKLGITFDASI